jgi:hypothetical protein
MTKSNILSVDNIHTTKVFLEFINATKAFCSFIEVQHCDSKSFLLMTQNHLLNLYTAGRNLSIIDVDIKNTIESEPELPDTTFKHTLDFIAERIPYRFYWHVFDPTDKSDTEAVCGDLFDDLCDIYTDIKRSILLFETNNAENIEKAIWEFKFYFEQHWGDHCSNALYAIHYFLQKNSW